MHATITSALREVQVGYDTTLLPIDVHVTRDGRRSKVVATADIATGSILISVVASSKVGILPASSHPSAVDVSVEYNIPSETNNVHRTSGVTV